MITFLVTFYVYSWMVYCQFVSIQPWPHCLLIVLLSEMLAIITTFTPSTIYLFGTACSFFSTSANSVSHPKNDWGSLICFHVSSCYSHEKVIMTHVTVESLWIREVQYGTDTEALANVHLPPTSSFLFLCYISYELLQSIWLWLTSLEQNSLGEQFIPVELIAPIKQNKT